MLSSIVVQQYSSNSSGIDWVSLSALILSGCALFFSIIVIYISKRVEIKYIEFEKLCIQNIDNILSNINDTFSLHDAELTNLHLTKFTSIFLDLQLFLTSLQKNKYKNIDLQKLILIIEDFTDIAYQNPTSQLFTLKAEFYSTKIKLYDQLYQHAIKKEIKLKNLLNLFNSKG